MSWDAYITNLKAADHSGQVPVEEAAIWGYRSGEESMWASTPGFNCTADEIRKLAGNRSSFFQNGVHIAGVKCRLLKDEMDDDTSYSLNLKTAQDASGNAYNMCVGKSKTAMVIVKGTKEASGGQLSSKVYNMVKYLKDNNI